VVYVGSQFAAIVLAGVVAAVRHRGMDMHEWSRGVATNGFVLSLATCASAIATVPAVRLLIGTVEDRPWSFLGFRRVSAGAIFISCGAMVAFIVLWGFVSAFVDRPPSPFMLAVYDSARFPALLAVVLVVVGPFLEELLFRGFLFAGLRAAGAPVWVAALVVSVIFAAIHTQYDAFDAASVFLMGLLFMAARVRFDSIVPSIVMHSLANAAAFAGVALSRMYPG
jgi:membrane protease YdiL (CAAX protease family)